MESKYIEKTDERITQQGVNNSSTKLVPEDTIMMSFKLTIGRMGIAATDLYTNEAIAAFYPIPGRVTDSWLYHILPRIAETGSAEQAIKGKTLSKTKLQRLKIPVPPLPEQRRISEVLDAADAAIRRTERVIAKLHEVKKGLLHDLLTRGLDADGNLRDLDAHPEQFKDSPLGRIPREWEVQTLQEVAQIDPESLGSGTPPDYQFKYIDISAVDGGVINWDAVTTETFETAPSRARRIVRPGDVLLGTVRPRLQSHAFANWSERSGYVCSTGFAVIRSEETVKPRFMRSFIFSEIMTAQLRRAETGSNYPAVPKSDVEELLVSVPCLSEQSRIAAVLDAHDARIRAEEATLDKLHQVKRGLMDDLLTGRVRV
jgi:type I restriction enzyme S subunit